MIDTKKITANWALVTFALTIPALLISTGCYVFLTKAPAFIAYFEIYAAILWVMWICAVVKERHESNGPLLTISWLAIDLMILATLCALAKGDPAAFWDTDLSELAFGISFAPFFFAGGINLTLLDILPSFETHFRASGVSIAFGGWLDFSIVAAVQSLLIFVITRFISGRLRTQNEQPEP